MLLFVFLYIILFTIHFAIVLKTLHHIAEEDGMVWYFTPYLHVFHSVSFSLSLLDDLHSSL